MIETHKELHAAKDMLVWNRYCQENSNAHCKKKSNTESAYDPKTQNTQNEITKAIMKLQKKKRYSPGTCKIAHTTCKISGISFISFQH